MADLTGRTIAFLASRGVEEAELAKPWEAVTQAGAKAVLLSPEDSSVPSLVGDWDRGREFPVDGPIAGADPAAYDALVLPGGTLNADAARLDEGIRSIVADQAEAGRAVAAICHAPWILVDAGVAEGKTLTGYDSVRIDLANAGASVVDEEVKVCTAGGWTLITSRTPADLDAFISAIDAL